MFWNETNTKDWENLGFVERMEAADCKNFGDAVKINLPDVAKEVQYFVELWVFEVGFCDKEAVCWALLTHFPTSSQESENKMIQFRINHKLALLEK